MNPRLLRVISATGIHSVLPRRVQYRIGDAASRWNDEQLAVLRAAAQCVRDVNEELARYFKPGRALSFMPVIGKVLEACDRCQTKSLLMIHPSQGKWNKLCEECWAAAVEGLDNWFDEYRRKSGAR